MFCKLNFQFQWSWIKIKVDLINRILKSECCALKGHCNLILESCAVIFMLLPECHFHTGFLIGIKLIQISVLNIVIHAGAIQIIFLSIQLFEDFTKSFMDQQITFQENATYKRKENNLDRNGILRHSVCTKEIYSNLLSASVIIWIMSLCRWHE